MKSLPNSLTDASHEVYQTSQGEIYQMLLYCKWTCFGNYVGSQFNMQFQSDSLINWSTCIFCHSPAPLKKYVEAPLAGPFLTKANHFWDANFIFFFWIGNKRLALEMPKSGESSTHEVYKQRLKKLGSRETKKRPSPYFTSNQSIKSIIDRVGSSIYTLSQFTKVYMNFMIIRPLIFSFLHSSDTELHKFQPKPTFCHSVPL